jgi:hypothetical protein
MTANVADLRVFSSEGLMNQDLGCRHRYREGFTGIPVKVWNGWEVFTVSPTVMHAIIDSYQAEMVQHITASVADGLHADEAWIVALGVMASMFWLGNLVVIDSRTLQSDPGCVEIIAPDENGRYLVGDGWCWDQVDPDDVHTVHDDTTTATGLPGAVGPSSDREANEPAQQPLLDSLDDESTRILQALADTGTSRPEELVERSGLSLRIVLRRLSLLEHAKLVEHREEGFGLPGGAS